MFKVIINCDLKEIHDIEELSSVGDLLEQYKEKKGLYCGSDMWNSVILDYYTNRPVYYVSFNGRIWDWDDEDNPFLKDTPQKRKLDEIYIHPDEFETHNKYYI